MMPVVASFLWAVTAQAQSDKSDFDLVCAITTGAQMNQDEQRAAATMPAHSLLYRPVKWPHIVASAVTISVRATRPSIGGPQPLKRITRFRRNVRELPAVH